MSPEIVTGFLMPLVIEAARTGGGFEEILSVVGNRCEFGFGFRIELMLIMSEFAMHQGFSRNVLFFEIFGYELGKSSIGRYLNFATKNL